MKHSEFRIKVENLGYVARQTQYMGREIVGVYISKMLPDNAFLEPVAVVTKEEKNRLSVNDDAIIPNSLLDALVDLAKTPPVDRLDEKLNKLYYVNLSGEVVFIFVNKGGNFSEVTETVAKEAGMYLNLTEEDLARLPDNYKPENGFTKLLESKWYL